MSVSLAKVTGMSMYGGQTPAPAAPAPVQAPVAAPVQAPGTDLASLQGQLGELQIQLSGLQAQWKGLRSQLDEMLRTNPARPGVQQQWADVGVQMAQVQGQIAGVQARIAQKQGFPVGITTRPPSLPRRPIDPNFFLPAGVVLLLAFVFPMSIGWARRIARGGRPQVVSFPSDQALRLERLEQAVDAIAIEVERISEGQRFVTKIFAERPARGAAEASSHVPASEPAPPRALGAGPAEPVHTPERESVRQRIITPH